MLDNNSSIGRSGQILKIINKRTDQTKILSDKFAIYTVTASLGISRVGASRFVHWNMGCWGKTKEGWLVGFGCPLVILGSSLSSFWWQISLKSVMIEYGQVHWDTGGPPWIIGEREDRFSFKICWPRGFLELGTGRTFFLALVSSAQFLLLFQTIMCCLVEVGELFQKMEQGSQIWLQELARNQLVLEWQESLCAMIRKVH